MTAGTITIGSTAEQDRAIAVITLAFSDDPVVRWVFPQAHQYVTYVLAAIRERLRGEGIRERCRPSRGAVLRHCVVAASGDRPRRGGDERRAGGEHSGFEQG